MILAVASDDRTTFDLLWRWTQAQLLRDDGLFSWKWDPNSTPHVSDPNNATDGDLLIAWALAEAAEFWPGGSYGSASKELATAITRAGRRRYFIRTGTASRDSGIWLEPTARRASHKSFLLGLPALWRLQSIAPDGPGEPSQKRGGDWRTRSFRRC